jgi:hypothetical protein
MSAPLLWGATKREPSMPVGAPAEEAVELYNRLTTVAPSDTANLGQIVWRLRTRRQKMPGDLPVAVALLQALLIGGEAPEAISIAKQLWPRRNALYGDVAITYGSVLAQVGMYEEALSFVGTPGPKGFDPVEVSTLIYAAWGTGQEEALVAALEHDSTRLRDVWSEIFAQMTDLGIMPYLKQRQDIVRRHVFHRQCGTHLIFTFSGNGAAELTHYTYMAASHDERSAITDAIYDELTAFYEEQGLNGIDFWSCAPVIVLDQRARPSLREESEGRELAAEAA